MNNYILHGNRLPEQLEFPVVKELERAIRLHENAKAEGLLTEEQLRDYLEKG